MVGKLIFAIVYLLIGNWVSSLVKDSDEAMVVTSVILWPMFIFSLIVYWIVKLLFWLIGGGERNG